MLNLQKHIDERRVDCLSDFSLNQLEVMTSHVKQIMGKYPRVQKIWITGSRVNGRYREKGSQFAKEYAEWRKKHGLKEKSGDSDWDYVTEPQVSGKFDSIDLLSVAGRHKILIYDKRILF